MKKEYLEIGKIVSVYGLKGEVKVLPWCDAPEILCGFDMLYIGKNRREISVSDARVFKNMVIMRFEGCTIPEDAEKFRGKILCVHRDSLKLEEGSYFIQDLIGMRVIDADDGRYYGILKDVLQTGANDVYEVKDDKNGGTILIPAIPDVIIETDVDCGVMKIRPLEGLLDAN